MRLSTAIFVLISIAALVGLGLKMGRWASAESYKTEMRYSEAMEVLSK